MFKFLKKIKELRGWILDLEETAQYLVERVENLEDECFVDNYFSGMAVSNYKTKSKIPRSKAASFLSRGSRTDSLFSGFFEAYAIETCYYHIDDNESVKKIAEQLEAQVTVPNIKKVKAKAKKKK